MQACNTSAGGLCPAMLTGPEVHISTLLVPATLATTDVAGYVTYLTSEWAGLWGVTLTIGVVAHDRSTPVVPIVQEEIDALDALMSAAADGGENVPPATALAGLMYACCTRELCRQAGCAVCHGTGAALADYFMPTRCDRRWYVSAAQPRITWRP
jgi:hypothetical protein